ncbi:hypothetical protein ACFQ0B_26775 [Nonomuraea thailandensis]
MNSTLVTFPSGLTSGRSTIVEAVPAGSGTASSSPRPRSILSTTPGPTSPPTVARSAACRSSTA